MSENAEIPATVEELQKRLLDLPPEEAMAFLAGLVPRQAPPEPEVVEPPAEVHTYRLRVDLRGTRPPVWRRVEVASDIALDELHLVIQAAMGWTDSHGHEFTVGTGRRAAAFVTDLDAEEGAEGTYESDVRLDQVLTRSGQKLRYAYDFGDGWEHTIKLEAITDGEPETPARCTAGRRACPPEDCGGVAGYAELAEWVRKGMPDGTVRGLDAAEMRRWLPSGWHPDHFDVEEANEALQYAASDCPEEVADILDRLDTPGRTQVQIWLAAPEWRESATIDETTARELLAPYLALIDVIGDGVKLTAAGYLPPAVVERLADVTGVSAWWLGKADREDLVRPIAQLRESAVHLGLLVKRKNMLTVTAAGARLATDPAAIWQHIIARLPAGRSDLHRQAGWLVLLAAGAGEPVRRWQSAVSDLLAEIGWITEQDGRQYAPPADSPTLDVLTVLAGDLAAGRRRDVPRPDVAPTARAAFQSAL